MKKRFVVLVATMLMAVPVLAVANVSNDQVLSQHVKEAVSGSTDQNTNSGSGIKTGHIVDTAVTTSKIADQAVSTAKIANGAVTSDKISGTISADKLETFAGIKVVHTGKADGVNTFNSINAAVAAAPDNSLIKIMPGSYTEDITLQKRITFEGSGIQQTYIYGNVYGSSYSSQGTFKDISVVGTTIRCYGGIYLERASISGDIYTVSTAGLRDSDVRGKHYAGMGVYGYNSTVYGCMSMGQANGTLDNVTVMNMSRDGVMLCNTAITISGNSPNTYRANRVVINPSYFTTGLSISGNFNLKIVNSELAGENTGISLGAGQHSVEVNGGKISGGTDAIGGDTANYNNSIFLSNTQIAGNVAPGSMGTTKLFNCFDSGYNPIANQ